MTGKHIPFSASQSKGTAGTAGGGLHRPFSPVCPSSAACQPLPPPARRRRAAGAGGEDSPLGISAHIPPEHPSGLPSSHALCRHISFYDNGIELYDGGKVKSKRKGGGVRGEIAGFSSHSRVRLRQSLLKLQPPPGSETVGMTLTIPGPNVSAETGRDMWSAFSLKACKMGYTFVWRVELQTRGQVHWHMVVFIPAGGNVGKLVCLWWDIVEALGPVTHVMRSGTICEASNRMALPGARERCVDVDRAESFKDRSRWYRYLSDHASKAKQAQLGWKGRQWGIVGRSRLHAPTPYRHDDLTSKEWSKVLRVLHRLTRSHRRRGSKGHSVWMGNPDTHRRIVDWAICERLEREAAKRVAADFVRQAEIDALPVAARMALGVFGGEIVHGAPPPFRP